MFDSGSQSSKYALTIVGLLSLIGIIPIFFTHYVPCVDIPQHAGQIAVYNAMHSPQGSPWASLFRIHWFTPYLIGYLLMMGLSHITGIVMACKVVLAIALWCIPVSTAVLMREIGNDPRLGLITIPTLYGFTFNFGFLNFLMAIPIGLLFMVWILQYQHHSSRIRFLLAALCVNLLFFCHVIIWGLFSAIAALIVVETSSDWKSSLKRLGPLLSSLPLVSYWFVHTLLQSEIHGGGGVGITNFPFGLWRIDIFPLLIGTNQWILNTGFGIFVLLAPWLLGYRLRFRWSRIFPFICCLLILLVGPHAVLGIAYIYERFAPLLIPFYLFAMQPARPATSSTGSPLFIWSGMLTILAVFIFNEINMMRGFAAETADFDTVLQQMQPDQRTLGMVFMRNSLFSSSPVYLHFPLWYQAEKNGLVDYNFGTGFMMLLQFKHLSVPANISGFEWNPQSFDWHRTMGNQYYYFMVRAPFDLSRFIFRNNLCHVHLLTHAGTWWVYQRNTPTILCTVKAAF